MMKTDNIMTKVNYKKIDFCGHLYHFWQYGKQSVIMHDTGYEEKGLKEEILEDGFVISETDIFTINPEQFCRIKK